MSYRIQPPKPHLPNRTMHATTTPVRWYIQNGSTANFAIPCFYIEQGKPIPTKHHWQIYHDYKGWAKHVCQHWDFSDRICHKGHTCKPSYDHIMHASEGCGKHGECKDLLDMSRLIPIRLRREGYTDVTVSFADDASTRVNDRLRVLDASIDLTDDWIVRLFLSAEFGVDLRHRERIPFSVAVIAGQRRDIVTTGIIEVIPGPYLDVNARG